MTKILIADPIHVDGEALLRTQADVDVRVGLKTHELLEIIGGYDALMVRSETQVTAEVLEAGERLQVVGRAGIGVDNIDLEAATRLGVAVVNAPTGNTIAAAEHTMALMLALARNIPQAFVSLRQGEWRRGDFVGIELRNRTLGIIGLGNIGREVARRAQSLEMRLVGSDPFTSPDYAQRFGVELVSLDRLMMESDFITVHTPLTEATHNLIGRRELQQVKPTVRIINCARGGLIDEEALFEALEAGKVAGAALDVFEHEPPTGSPLLSHSRVIVTPHLGASTAEAQTEVAIQAAEQVLMVLRGEPAPNTVNAFFILPETQQVVGPYGHVAEVLGRLAVQLSEGQLSSVTIRYQGEIAEYDTAIIKASALIGVLGPATAQRVNLVNASLVASQRGLSVVEEKRIDGEEHYGNLVTVELRTSLGTTIVSGTVVRGGDHIVQVGEYWIDIVSVPGYLLFTQHQDNPGLIGAVGTITGHHGINISFMEVGRLAAGGRAMMVLGLDDPVPDEVLNELRAIPSISKVTLIRI